MSIRYLLLLIVLVYGCKFDSSVKNESKRKFGSFTNNEQLLENIKDYRTRNLKDFKSYIILLDYAEKDDTIICKISSDINMSTIIDNPPVYYFKVDTSYVIIQSNLTNYNVIESDTLHMILRESIKEQYQEYKQRGHIPLVINYRCEEWVLKFRSNKLIDREINNPFL